MAFDLQRTLLVLLHAAPGPLSVQDIQNVFSRYHERAAARREEAREDSGSGEPPPTPSEDFVPALVTAAQIREAMAMIDASLAGSVLCLREGAQGWRLHTRPEHADWVRCLRDEPPPVRLTQAALETLAIVAYRQPVTRSEIEAIRGVSSENALTRLMDRGLVRVAGRADLPGRPIQYATTREFLELLGIRSLEELPASDVLSAREIDAWLRTGSRRITDEQVGLPGLETESAAPAAGTPHSPTPAASPSENVLPEP